MECVRNKVILSICLQDSEYADSVTTFQSDIINTTQYNYLIISYKPNNVYLITTKYYTNSSGNQLVQAELKVAPLSSDTSKTITSLITGRYIQVIFDLITTPSNSPIEIYAVLKK